MSFSEQWEETYSNGAHMSIWPWSDLVSLFMRSMVARDKKSKIRVLEIGFGAGANIPLFMSIPNVEYFGIEGSETAVKLSKERYPLLAERLAQADFTKTLVFPEKFDFIIDRGSLTHNSTRAIEGTIDLINNALASDGKFLGIDWFSTKHSDAKSGQAVDDGYSRINYSAGQFVGVGLVHFSDEAHLHAILSPFDIVFMEEKIRKTHIPQSNHQWAGWNFIVQKKQV